MFISSRTCLLLIFWMCLLVPPVIAGEAAGTYEVGLRGGVDSGRVEMDYVSSEIYFQKDLPWSVDLTEELKLKSRFDAGAFYLQTDGDDGAMFSAGLDFVVSVQGRVEFEVGFRPTWLPDFVYGRDNFGGELQFTSHAGVAVKKGSLVYSYRFQHTSNAGAYDCNPGLDLHLLGVGYRF